MVCVREISEVVAVVVGVGVELRVFLLLRQDLVVDCGLVFGWLTFVVVVWFPFPARK